MMFGATLARYGELRAPVKSLIFLFWIYTFTGALVGVFTQLYLYQRFNSLTLNVVASLLFYTGIMVGFSVCGYVVSRLRLNSKYGFAWSFLIMGISILAIFYSSNLTTASLAMTLYGVGQGLFWLTIHTFELSETRDEERDFYSSLLSAGGQIFGLLGPACATLLIWISGSLLHVGTYTLLFTIAPLVYVLGFFCFSTIQDYYPEPVHFADISHFFSDRKNLLSQFYMMGAGFRHFIVTVVSPLVTLFILGTVLHVGVYNTFFAIFSSFCLLVIAQYRNSSNRLRILGITSIALALFTIQFGYFLTLLALILYTIGDGLFTPIMRVSEHVIDLQTMESMGRPSSDFYATMLLRDFSLWIWRSVAGIILLLIVNSGASEKSFLALGLYVLASSFILTFFGAYVLVLKKWLAKTA